MTAERIPFQGPQSVPTRRKVSPELQALYDERRVATLRLRAAKEELGKAENALYSVKERIKEHEAGNEEDRN